MKMLLLTLFGCAMLAGCASAPQKIVMPSNAVLIDVRTPAEFNAGHIQGAVNLPHDRIGDTISNTVSDKSTPIYLYCRSGRRVKAAMETLQRLGYNNMHNLGGFEEAKRQLDQ